MRVFWFGTMHTGWVKNKTHKTSTVKQMINSVMSLNLKYYLSRFLGFPKMSIELQPRVMTHGHKYLHMQQLTVAVTQQT